ncbi:hypothetical protein B0T18DRAFT_223357 [Schizothecium vesticola]|uniref:Uncharacterized protein n=1 Tax=Schizothecium vesticola TaxID=314040 RepID=A0AA40EKJ4_9PEZI|nr:hypothetical protein B0T18DRAFT_223357 [Schizothecium vesticola]
MQRAQKRRKRRNVHSFSTHNLLLPSPSLVGNILPMSLSFSLWGFTCPRRRLPALTRPSPTPMPRDQASVCLKLEIGGWQICAAASSSKLGPAARPACSDGRLHHLGAIMTTGESESGSFPTG